MKKRKSLADIKVNKKVTLIATAVMLALALVIGSILVFNSGVTGSYEDEFTASSSEDFIKSEMQDYIKNYFQTTTVTEYISEEDMAKIIAEISTGVLNSLPESTLSENETFKIREMISEAITEEITNLNSGKEISSEYTTVLTEQLQDYINKTIVPNITADIQISKGAIDDLKSSLSNLSTEYKLSQTEYDLLIDDLYSKFANLDKNSGSVTDITNIKNDITKLSEVLESYKSSTSSQTTTLEKELLTVTEQLEIAKKEIESLTEKQLEDIKAALSAQIANNAALNEQEKKELLDKIGSISASNTEDLNKAIADLQNQINEEAAQNEKDLLAAIEALKGNGAGDTTLSDLMSQINNSGLTENQKQQLVEYLKETFGDATSYTDAEVEALKGSLTDKISTETEELNKAVDELESTLASEVEKLQEKINLLQTDVSDLNEKSDTLQNNVTSLNDKDIELQNKDTELSNKDNELQDQITSISDKLGLNGSTGGTSITEQITNNGDNITNLYGLLGDCSFELRADGHFYITGTDANGNTVTKKLDFAQ